MELGVMIIYSFSWYFTWIPDYVSIYVFENEILYITDFEKKYVLYGSFFDITFWDYQNMLTFTHLKMYSVYSFSIIYDDVESWTVLLIFDENERYLDWIGWFQLHGKIGSKFWTELFT